MIDKNFNIWEGIYNSFDEAPVVGDGFESERWINQNLKKIKTIIQESKNNDFIFDNLPLYTISSDLYAKNKKVKILDFGGGMGNSFVPLCSVLPDSRYVDFTVIEGQKNVIEASKIFINDNRIKFLTKLPDDKDYDIIHIQSSLQYIENWQSLLDTLSSYKAKYFIFTDLPAGDIEKTYVTIQNYYESKIPYWFFKIDDIIDQMSKNAFELIFKSYFMASILGKYKKIPQKNFDGKWRIGFAKNFVFRRKI